MKKFFCFLVFCIFFGMFSLTSFAYKGLNMEAVGAIGKTYSEIEQEFGEITKGFNDLGAAHYQFGSTNVWGAFFDRSKNEVYVVGNASDVSVKGDPDFVEPSPQSVCISIECVVGDFLENSDTEMYSVEELSKVTEIAFKYEGISEMTGMHSVSADFEGLKIFVDAEKKNCVQMSDLIYVKAQDYNSVKSLSEAWSTIEQNAPSAQDAVYNKSEKLGICINGDLINTEQEPVMQNNRTFVPIRVVCDSLGLHIEWYGSTKSIIITDKKNDNKIFMQIDNKNASVNGDGYVLDAAPFLQSYDDTHITMVPVRFIAESLGYCVDWDAVNKNVRIYEKYYEFTKSGGETVKIPVIEYLTGEYAEVDILMKAIEGYKASGNNSKLNGTIKIWDVKASAESASIVVEYDLSNKSENGEHKYDMKVNGNVISRYGIDKLRLTKNNGAAFVHLNDFVTLKSYAIQDGTIVNTHKVKNKIEWYGVTLSADYLENPTSITYYINWRTTYPTKNNNVTVVSSDETNIWRTPMAITSDGNSYKMPVQVTCSGDLQDGYLDITITSGDAVLNFTHSVNFKTDKNIRLSEAENKINDKIDAICKKITKKLIDKQDQLYSNVFNKSYTIKTMAMSEVPETDATKAVKMFFGKKYFEYLNKRDKESWNTIDESTIIKGIYSKLNNGVVEIGKTEEFIYNEKKYSIHVGGFGIGSSGCYTVTVNGGQQFLVNSNMNEVKSSMYDYQKELEGMYNTAVQECIESTFSDVGKDLMGLDNLNKILTAWVHKNIFGDEYINNTFIDVALNGLTKGYEDNDLLSDSQKTLFSGDAHTDLNKLYTMTDDAIKLISSTKGNEDAKECSDAFKTLSVLTDWMGGWEVILQ